MPKTRHTQELELYKNEFETFKDALNIIERALSDMSPILDRLNEQTFATGRSDEIATSLLKNTANMMSSGISDIALIGEQYQALTKHLPLINSENETRFAIQNTTQEDRHTNVREEILTILADYPGELSRHHDYEQSEYVEGNYILAFHEGLDLDVIEQIVSIPNVTKVDDYYNNISKY